MAGTEPGARVEVLQRLGIAQENDGASYGPWLETAGDLLVSYDPRDSTLIASVAMAQEEDYDEVVYHAVQNFGRWRMFPDPKRGQIVRDIGEELRRQKN